MTFLLYIRISDFQSHLDCRTTKTMRWPIRISAQFDQSSLSARDLGSLATHWAHSKDWSDWVDALVIWVFGGWTGNFVGLVTVYGFYLVLTHIQYRFFGSNDMYNFSELIGKKLW